MARQHSRREGYDGTGAMAPDDVDATFANRVWGAGGWVLHEGCPAATAALGRPAAVLHSRGFHDRLSEAGDRP